MDRRGEAFLVLGGILLGVALIVFGVLALVMDSYSTKNTNDQFSVICDRQHSIGFWYYKIESAGYISTRMTESEYGEYCQ